EDDPRVRLWKSFLRIVDSLRPRAVLVENVPELAAWREGELVMDLCDRLHARGYRTEARILRAVDYGVAQFRQRLFIVGLQPGYSFEWPDPQSDLATLRTAIGALPRVGPDQRQESLPYRGPLNGYQRLMRRGIARDERKVIHDHITRAVRTDDAKAFRLMRQ